MRRDRWNWRSYSLVVFTAVIFLLMPFFAPSVIHAALAGMLVGVIVWIIVYYGDKL